MANNIEEIGLRCVGCRSCEQTCPTQSISMQKSPEGFLYPVVSDSCVECGLCLKRCPAVQTEREERNPLEVWGFRLCDNNRIMKSASGGAGIAAIAEILEQKGIVYGAAYDENLYVKHIEVFNMIDAEKLQSSKYVQSDINDCFAKANRRLKNGETVLFTGTPCQIAGLKSFLGKEYDNLYTVDLICHGVPSPLFFKKYIEFKNKKMNGRTIYYNFRSKEKRGWGTQYMIKTNTKTKTKTLYLDPYGKHFMASDCYRECCYQCPYSNTNRIGDLTIGDFWGVMNSHPEFYSSKGVSTVLVNSEKGRKLFLMMKDGNESIRITLEEALVKQVNLVKPSHRPTARNAFYKDIESPNFVENIKVGLQIKERIKTAIPVQLVMLLKRLMG